MHSQEPSPAHLIHEFCGKGLHVALDGALQSILGYFQVVRCLQIQPETGAGIEVPAQPQGGIRRDAPAPVDDFRDARHGHAKIQRQLVHAEAQRGHEVLAQNPALMAEAMKHAVIAGRQAYLAGRMQKKLYASASSPLEGVVR